MNSYEILRQLRNLAGNTSLDAHDLEVIRIAIQHIGGQDREIAELREDITNTDFTNES